MLQVNNFLYKATDPDPLEEPSSTRHVVVHHWAGQMERISAFASSPYRTDWYYYLACWLHELLWGRAALSIRVEHEPHPFYIKVKDVVRVLQDSAKKWVGKYLTKDTCQVIDQVKRIASQQKMVLGYEEKASLKRVAQQISCKNLIEALEAKSFNQKILLYTLIAIGKKMPIGGPLISEAGGKHQYSFIIHANAIEILIDVLITDSIRQINSLNLMDLTIKNTYTHKSFSKSFLDQLKNKQHDPCFITCKQQKDVKTIFSKINEIAMSCQIPPLKKNNFQSLIKRVEPANLLYVLEKLDSPEEQALMINTYNKIGQVFINESGLFKRRFSVYIGKKGGQVHAHAIDLGKRVFINLDPFAEGATTAVSTAFLLNTLEPQVRLKDLKKDTKTGQPSLPAKEKPIIQELYKTKNPYLVDPCNAIFKVENRMIRFQNKYDGSGDALKSAPLHHQLNAFKQMAWGLGLMHQSGFVHGDVKPANFLIKGDLSSLVAVEARLSDLKSVMKKNEMVAFGTLRYLSNQVIALRNQQMVFQLCLADPTIDCFALGITLLEILDPTIVSENKPYLGTLDQKQIDDLFEEIGAKFSNEAHALIKKTRLALLDICRRLVRANASEILDCLTAGNQIEQIQKEFTRWQAEDKDYGLLAKIQ